MKLNHTFHLNKFFIYSLTTQFTRIEILTKKISELNKLSNYMNSNFKVKFHI